MCIRDRISRADAHWVHCPRSHDYFGHQAFAVDAIRNAEINLCLGTDSLATVRDANAELDLFEEMRMFVQHHPQVTADACVEMVTQNAARALGLEEQIGTLESGKMADLITLPWSEKNGDVAEQIVAHQGKVTSTMINGEWVSRDE